MGMSQANRRRERTGPAAQSQQAIHVGIDRLALYGVAPAEAGRLARALEAQFHTLAAQPSAGLMAAEIERLPSARIVAGATPEQTGRAAAGAIWSGIVSTGQGTPR
jgi:hypothetical protein